MVAAVSLFTPLLLGAGLAWAAQPVRAVRAKPAQVVWQQGLASDEVLLKVVEGDRRIPVVPGSRVEPLFRRPRADLRADSAAYDPQGRLADLTTWWRVQTPPGQAAQVAQALNQLAWVERAELALQPAPPPVDLAPETPDLVDEQDYRLAAPAGLGFAGNEAWPAVDGRNVRVADLEYSWLATHEDLASTVDAVTWGHDIGLYDSHGTAVLGLLVAGDNGYGVTGLVPAASPVVVYPYVDADTFSIAAAVDAAAALLQPGDVLLIEQQIFDPRVGTYLPAEWDTAAWDAISLAVAKGIVVVEPAANGGQSLDADILLRWFDRSVRDSGAILVGGGASPESGLAPRTWVQWGSNYGQRVDLQAWYDSVATAWTDEHSTVTPDLFLPEDRDPRQGYTSEFGGTSGASALVAGVCAATNSVAIDLHGEPMAPLDLRALLVSTGTPQPADDAAVSPIGPQPDLQAALRFGLLP